VIDRSGSMSEPAVQPASTTRRRHDTETPCKLDYVKEAALRMLDGMPDGNAVALITFDDQVSVAKPLTVLSQSTRKELVRTLTAIRAGGSTNLEGGLRAGIQQLTLARDAYPSVKLVLLSDGLANVGESRPAVLGEITAGAAHNRITISTLGVGVDYHLGLMSHLAECGNGEFHHVAAIDDLRDILAGEFLDAAAVRARNVEVTVRVPDRVAVGSNLNRYPQADVPGGVRVSLGDLLREREFLLEITTPVELSGDTLDVDVLAEGSSVDGVLLEARATLQLPLLTVDEIASLAVDEDLVNRVTQQVQAKADMDSAVAAEAGDIDAANRAVASARHAAQRLSALYGPEVGDRAHLQATVGYLDSLASRLDTPAAPAMLKSRFATASRTSKGRGSLLGACPACGETAFFETQHAGRLVRSCNACGHTERG
jgi:Ca-activated chloride channel family protein